MLELTTTNTAEYLADSGRIAAGESVRVEELAGGVSNVVLRITPDASTEFVVKQSREQLRTQLEWRSRLDRVWREVAVMRILNRILAPGLVPRILFEDRENYLFGMEAVDRDHVVWKTVLLEGTVDPEMGARLGSLLADVHGGTWMDAGVRNALPDLIVFDELRVDPYYRKIAAVHSPLRDRINALIVEMETERTCLVLGDFSPKNILLTGHEITLVDFETGHFGDPGFDLGFFLSHLTLKGIRLGREGGFFIDLSRRFWDAYRLRLAQAVPETSALDARSVLHWAGCVLARIDGKSPVDYLDASGQAVARKLAIDVLHDPPCSLVDCFDLTSERMRAV